MHMRMHMHQVMPTGYAYSGGEMSFSRPFFVPFWGLVGDIELGAVEEVISALSPTQYIAPLLIWTYLVFANIVLVNLLIATMTATYERVKNQSQLYWNFERRRRIGHKTAVSVAVPRQRGPHGPLLRPHLEACLGQLPSRPTNRCRRV